MDTDDYQYVPKPKHEPPELLLLRTTPPRTPSGWRWTRASTAPYLVYHTGQYHGQAQDAASPLLPTGECYVSSGTQSVPLLGGPGPGALAPPGGAH